MGGKDAGSRSGPKDSGEQSVPGGGSGKIDHENSSIHYTDYDKSGGGHNSWDEKGGEVSGEHSTPHK